MEPPSICLKLLHDMLSARSFPHALEVLAEATGTTAILFGSRGEVLVGPMPGNGWVRAILECEGGRELIIETHRWAVQAEGGQGDKPVVAALLDALDHFSLPLTVGGDRAGTLTIGDRPRKPLPESLITRVADALQADAAPLRVAAEQLRPWSAVEAAAAKDLAALLARLFGELCAQEQSLQNRIEELSAVYNITALTAGALDLREILNKIAQLVTEVMNVRACSIRLLDENSGTLVIKAVYNLSAEYLSKGPVTVDRSPIDEAALAGQIVYVPDLPDDPRTVYPQQARAEGIVSGLVCGMIYRGKPVGAIRVYTGKSHVFSPFEESLLRAVSSQTAAAIVNARLFSQKLDAERFAHQLAYAGKVQRRMIPSTPPNTDRLEIGAVYRPTFEVGGDFYDFINLPKKNLGIAIADVSGKGVPASLQMASLRAALRVNAYHMYDIDRIMSQTNRHLCRDAGRGEFATVFYGVISPTMRFTYCNAGHNPPMLLRDGRTEKLEIGGTVLGVDPGSTFERGIEDLKAGDVLLMYTDGAVEALNFGDERFGTDRLADSLRQHADQSAQRIAQNILWDIRRFRGLADRTDDLTMVVAKIHGG
ncbi:MAG TPA: GAF domain-containing SpoIIE family protein phosphatase [Phycisphaerae bacterium]|nr:GAF domain-containing SpoIIE family protein phosphatase [Phycisphaerae bacterium]